MTSQILKFLDFTKTQKIDLVSETFFSSNKKDRLLQINGYFMAKNTFVAKVTFNNWLFPELIRNKLSCQTFFEIVAILHHLWIEEFIHSEVNINCAKLVANSVLQVKYWLSS